MAITREVPEIEGFGVGKRMRAGWALVWARLSDGQFHDGHSLAEELAPAAELKPISLLTLMHKMTKAGLLESEKRPQPSMISRSYQGEVNGEPAVITRQISGHRSRSAFRIKP